MRQPAWLLIAGIGLAACNGSTGAGNDPPQQVQQEVTLTPFSTCDDLEQYIEDNHVKEMKERIERSKQYLTGYSGGGGTSDMGAASQAPDNNSGGPTDYTTTNTQVKGVDEADFVKNDGTRIFTLSGGTLFATQSWPPEAIASKGQLQIEGGPISMYLDEKDRITVLSRVWLADEGSTTPSYPSDCYYCGDGIQATKVTVVDASDLANLKVTGERYFPGYLTDSRRIGSSVRLVIGNYFYLPEGIRYWPEYDYEHPEKFDDKDEIIAALDSYKAPNEALIRSQSLDFWLKKGKRKTPDGALVEVGYQCSDFTQMNAPTKLTGLLDLITVNLDKLEAPGHRLTLLGETGVVYASKTNLYVAEWHWWWGGWAQGQQDAAYIHKFDISDPDKTIYKASGPIAGHIHNQFSLDEQDDKLRVAHTVQTWNDDPQVDQPWVGSSELNSRVSVLGEEGGALSVIGKTPDFGKGERLQSARFLGDKGFVVTFRQVDPLFTFDLADPTNPKLIGELTIPGFSTYIHPLGENHLLTIGVFVPPPDSNGATNWTERRQQLSIFDVSDLAKPTQAFTMTTGTAYGWSEAQWDHKAFNYFPSRGLLAVPFSDYRSSCTGGDSGCWDSYWEQFTSEVRVFKIDTVTGIEPKGALSMADVYQSYGQPLWGGSFTPWIRRSVMATDAEGNDFVYAISDAGVRVANLQTLETLGTATFVVSPSTK